MKENSEESSRQVRIWAVVLVCLTLLTMGRLCGMEFTWWDDNFNIHQNPNLNPPTWSGLAFHWTHVVAGLYVPVTYTVWAAIASISHVEPDFRNIQLNSWFFHTANILLHVGNVLLVYAISRRALKTTWPAAVGAAVFAIHPVQVEAVAWAAGLKDLLFTTFLLIAVWEYLIYADAPVGKRFRRTHFVVGCVCVVLATLSKPTAVVAPLLAGAVDLWIVRRPWRRVVGPVAIWAVLVGPCVVWAKLVQIVPSRAPFWARPGIAADALAFYGWKLIWPAHLVVDYGHFPKWVMAHDYWKVDWVVPVVVLGVVWRFRRRQPVLMAAAMIFVAGLLPVLGFTPFMFQAISTTADHYLYLPMLGVAIAAGWAVALMPLALARGVVCVVVLAMGTRSFLQERYWENDSALDLHTLEINPESYVAHTNYAAQLDAADTAFNSSAHADEAIAHLREAIRINPSLTLPKENLAIILIKRGKIDEAVQLLSDTLHPTEEYSPLTQGNMGQSHYILGLVLDKRGRPAEAIGQYDRALETMPGDARVLAARQRAVEHRLHPTTRRATTTTRSLSVQ